ncbi:hypothetical protein ACIP10_10715 [Streptomyces galbus]|uniref:hypothetical protein n=1 Tax=Streptomyces galbus TaxID=33898 RepID=UPI0037AF52C4
MFLERPDAKGQLLSGTTHTEQPHHGDRSAALRENQPRAIAVHIGHALLAGRPVELDRAD